MQVIGALEQVFVFWGGRATEVTPRRSAPPLDSSAAVEVERLLCFDLHLVGLLPENGKKASITPYRIWLKPQMQAGKRNLCTFAQFWKSPELPSRKEGVGRETIVTFSTKISRAELKTRRSVLRRTGVSPPEKSCGSLWKKQRRKSIPSQKIWQAALQFPIIVVPTDEFHRQLKLERAKEHVDSLKLESIDAIPSLMGRLELRLCGRFGQHQGRFQQISACLGEMVITPSRNWKF